jgi:hypothetical protein
MVRAGQRAGETFAQARRTTTEREKLSRMSDGAIDFVPWGLEGAWPSRRWVEPIPGRPEDPLKGVRLCHASPEAMVLTCTFPRERFDSTVAGSCDDPVREIAYETTFTLVNLALHQIKAPGARPEGLISSLVQFANQQADRCRDWATTHWGFEAASITGMGGWQSGFSLAYPGVYVVAHACGVSIEHIRLYPVKDLSGYEITSDPLEIGAMHWELWRSEPPLGYEDLARVLVTR